MKDHFSEINSTKCGTPATMAPEVLFSKKGYLSYDYRVDIWSLGIILHQLVYDCHPFHYNPNLMKVIFLESKIKESIFNNA